MICSLVIHQHLRISRGSPAFWTWILNPIPSSNQTWRAGKWTIYRDFPSGEFGDFPGSHVKWNQSVHPKKSHQSTIFLRFSLGFPLDFPLIIEQRHEFTPSLETSCPEDPDPHPSARSPLEKTSPLERATRRLLAGWKNGGFHHGTCGLNVI